MSITDRFKINNRVLFCFLGIIIYKIILDFAYSNIVSLLYGYQSFNNEIAPGSYLISWLFLVLLSPLIIKTFNNSNLSSSILTILIIISLIPTTTLIAYNRNYEIEFVVLSFIYWLLILLLNIILPSVVITRRSLSENGFIFKLITLILCAGVLYVSWKYTGFRFHFGLMDVYSIRSEAREFNVPTILGYISASADNILPIIVVYLLYKRKYLISLFIGILVLLNFGIAGSKHVLFLLLFAIIGFYFVRKLKFSYIYVWIMSIIVYLTIIEYKLFDTYFLTAFITYRIVFIPAKLNYVYYDYFSIREFDYFRQSALKWFGIESPYSDNIGFLIGYHDIGDFSARANNGLFSDAYFNFGTLGIIIFPFILVLILKFFEGASKKLDERILFIVSISISLSLISVPFTTALLSTGLLLMLVLLYSIPRNNNTGKLKFSN